MNFVIKYLKCRVYACGGKSLEGYSGYSGKWILGQLHFLFFIHSFVLPEIYFNGLFCLHNLKSKDIINILFPSYQYLMWLQ